jgi:sterol desaturase/sphingolipid hydroxylase (fatty acid hydroxylase superfamily)
MDWVKTTAESLLASYSAMIQGVLAGYAERLADPTSYPFLVTPEHRLHWVYLFSYLVIALVIYLHARRGLGRITLKGFLGFWLPSSVYRRRSTALDLKYYIVNTVFVRAAFVTTLIGSFYLFGEVFEATLGALWSAPVAATEAAVPIQVAYGAALLLMADFGFFVGHYLGHKVPLLWEFHKVHHSADVLNPLTNYRFHPLDTILLGLFIGIFSGVVKGAFGFAFPGGIGGTGAASVNVTVLLLFNLTANLRHSHVWLSYGWHLSHIFSSPAQHQIHHSFAARHIDRNFGLMLSLWDWLVGSLYVPRRREELEFGLTGGEHEEFNSLWRLYTLPLVKARSVLFGRGARQGADRRLHGEM